MPNAVSDSSVLYKPMPLVRVVAAIRPSGVAVRAEVRRLPRTRACRGPSLHARIAARSRLHEVQLARRGNRPHRAGASRGPGREIVGFGADGRLAILDLGD